ncbi:Uncharacterised protein [Vibrio cholerae]|nr:Uncharacterised protein [Vibrio cholerae]
MHKKSRLHCAALCLIQSLFRIERPVKQAISLLRHFL